MLEISSVALQYWIEELMNIEVDGGINKDTIHRSANIEKKIPSRYRFYYK
ncbi:hypothetical protein LOD59_09125 [Xylella fastidiosa subsp. multiplex]|nr:hypothetical protein [Xylella fastidiosa]MDD0927785.1 hypothetical protein [Xylella fastidiosa subsp. multiplex]